MDTHADYLNKLLDKGGPSPNDYSSLNTWFSEVQLSRRNQPETAHINLYKTFGEILSTRTLVGHVFSKPHGYSGDYEIIEKIYRKQVTSDNHLSNWDHYFHWTAAAKAVIVRKEYFVNQMKRAEEDLNCETIKVLNVGSGPCNDILEFYEKNPKSCIRFTCIDHDQKAINHAKNALGKFSKKVTFIKTNALKVKLSDHYHIIWSSGLFDYLSDRTFAFLLNKLYLSLDKKRGSLIIGNFSPKNPTRHAMEFFGWHLHYRSEEDLIRIATNAEICPGKIKIHGIMDGLILFLHISA